MTPLILLLLLLQTPGPVRVAPAALEGVWVAEAMEANGKPMPAVVVTGVRFTFKGETLTMAGLGGPTQEQRASFVVDERVTPKRLDFTSTDGRTAYAIYEIADGVLRLIFVRGGDAASRPVSFAAEAGSNKLLIVFRKSQGSDGGAGLSRPGTRRAGAFARRASASPP